MGRKKKEQTEEVSGEQLDLIDAAPENAKEILKAAKKYEALKRQRMAIGEKEAAEKEKVLDLIKKSNPQRLSDGKIKFTLETYTIIVTPRDELVQVKNAMDEGGSDE